MENFKNFIPNNVVFNNRCAFVSITYYYILLTYIFLPDSNLIPYSTGYFGLVLPGWLYIIFNYHQLFIFKNTISRLWWLFIVTSLAISLAQHSASLAYNSIYMGFIAIIITNSGYYLSLRELNFIFIVCVIGSFVVYMSGSTIYSFLPYQNISPGCHAVMDFRISLFRVLPESAALSLFVILWNIFMPTRSYYYIRYSIIFLALYFLFFSGLRSAIISFICVIPFLFNYSSMYRLKWLFKLKYIIAIAFVLLPFAYISVNYQAKFIDFATNYIFHHETCSSIASQADKSKSDNFDNHDLLNYHWAAKSLNRHCAAKYQFNTFVNSPILGNIRVRPINNNEITDIGCDDMLSSYCDACVISTYWLAKGGILGVILLLIYFVQLKNAIVCKSFICISTLLTFGIFLQAWGVMFVPYHFVFYILASIPNIKNVKCEVIY